MQRMNFRSLRHRLTALALSLCLVLSLCPFFPTARAADAESALDKLVNWGVVHGYPDGSLRPERTLTRAEFVAMVNRAYGYTETGPTPFEDVSEASWYHDDIGTAYNAHYFNGVSPRRAGPDTPLTREQAVVLLARNMRLDPVAGEVVEFNDGRDFGAWSRGYARAAAQLGIINGYGDGNFRPGNDITRGDMATMLQRALGTLVNTPGTHTLSDVYGNVTISSTNTTLKDTTIGGNLYITGGLDLGDIELENVRVLGDIIVAGGGESHSGEDSIILRNVSAESLLVDSIADQYVSLRSEGSTEIERTELRSDAFVQDRSRPGQGLLNIELLSPDPDAAFTLSGNLENVINKTPNSSLNVAVGTVESLTVDELARDSTLNLDINSTVLALNMDTGANVTGVGDIERIQISAPGVNVEMLPDTISIRPGLTADIAGENMNTQQAEESSADPRLLAGYPKVRNIAPTTATGVFETNKAGTVYWAISQTVDGSIGEDELITPTEGNTRITLNGNTPVAASNTEVTAALTRLQPDSNYYISTVMTDGRDRHSPVKVAAFATPDNTTPAFTSGYPRILLNDYTVGVKQQTDSAGAPMNDENGRPLLVKVPNFRAQAAAMASKTCQLYYALYPAGSAQPTTQQFRTGALGQTISSGVEDVVKNQIWTKDFTNLQELTSYDLYLWLSDSDGARSSAIQRLNFSTVDGTPPEFQYNTPDVVGNPPATSIPVRANLNEAATVHWVVVKHGYDYINIQKEFAEYIKDNSKPKLTGNTPTEFVENLRYEALKMLQDTKQGNNAALDNKLETLKRKIESGTGATRNGQMAATANRDITVNMTGLTAETAYDIYIVAKDRAGNYSDIQIIEDVHTLDTTPPTVRQEFQNTDESGNPYASTDIYLIFSEDVRLTTPPTDRSDPDLSSDLRVALAEKSLSQLSTGEELEAFLTRSVRFFHDSGDNPTDPLTTFSQLRASEREGWVIDYSRATVSRDAETAEVTVTLPTRTDDDGNLLGADGKPLGALNLKSDSTYHFEFTNLQDLATTPNRIRPADSRLSPFRTIAAQVTLRALNVTDTTPTVVGERIPIDMAFSLTPVATNVEDDVDWDIVFWSDSSVAFEVYELDGPSNTNNTSVPVRRVADGVFTNEIVNREIVNDNGEEPADSTVDDFTGYIGRSLFRNFYGLSANPSVTGKGNKISLTDAGLRERGILRNNVPKYYGIHFTSINHKEEGQRSRLPKADGTRDPSETWDATINFRIAVLTGKSVDLGNLSSNITKETLASSEQYWSITQIHVPRPFTLQKMYSNNAAPNFYQGYPQFRDITDISATLRVMLDRPGTVYYAVAPVDTAEVGTGENRHTTYDPAIGTTVLGPPRVPIDVELQDAGKFIKDNVPTSGGVGLKLFSPAPSAVYSPNFGSDDVFTGSRTLGTSYLDIPLNDLRPNTLYFAYFVMQGVGQVYSERTLLYQFTMEDIVRPKLYIVSTGSSSLSVRSRNMNAVADYAVFQMNGLPTQLSEQFYSASVLGSKFSDPNFPENYKTNYTVYDAIYNQDSNGGSLYDAWASAEHKDSVRKLITGQIATGGRIDSSGNIRLVQNEPDAFDCAEKYNIQAGQQYLFIASARSSMADIGVSSDAYGFSAYQPVYIMDEDPPVISAISGNVRVNSSEAITGNIYLTFDKDLYYYQSATDKRTFVNPPAGTGQKSIYNFQYLETPDEQTSSTDSGTMRSTNITSSRTVRINVGGWNSGSETVVAHSGDVFRAAPEVVSFYSSPNYATPLQFTLRYERDEGKVYVDVNSTSWYEPGIAELTTTVDAPEPTSLYLSRGNFTMNVGEEIQIEALPEPANAAGTIRWAIGAGGTGQVDLSATTGRTITLKATREGTVTLTATMGSRSASCDITVNAVGITLTCSNASKLTGNTLSLSSTDSNVTLMAQPTDPNVLVLSQTWQSYNTAVVNVTTGLGDDPGGEVTVVSKGSTVIRVTLNTSIGTISTTCTVNVT